MTIVSLNSIDKSFADQKALEDLSLSVKAGEFLAIQGPSGSGKSTLLNIIGLLESPDSGSVELFEQKAPKPFSSASRKVLHDDIGFLFQNYALLEERTVLYNLELALDAPRTEKSRQLIAKALQAVGLDGYEKKKAAQCSGGEQQRIAMARLLLTPCRLILADEPTANLDPANKNLIARLLLRMKESGKTIIMVTHDPEMAQTADRIVYLSGKKQPHLPSVSEETQIL